MEYFIFFGQKKMVFIAQKNAEVYSFHDKANQNKI